MDHPRDADTAQIAERLRELFAAKVSSCLMLKDGLARRAVHAARKALEGILIEGPKAHHDVVAHSQRSFSKNRQGRRFARVPDCGSAALE